jgi:hypothetical protein
MSDYEAVVAAVEEAQRILAVSDAAASVTAHDLLNAENATSSAVRSVQPGWINLRTAKATFGALISQLGRGGVGKRRNCIP